MSRRAPRSLADALVRVSQGLAPATLLARVQDCWSAVVGPAVADEAWPTAEHDGVLTVTCRSAVWAQELELLSTDLLGRLNVALADADDGGRLTAIRVTARRPRPSS